MRGKIGEEVVLLTIAGKWRSEAKHVSFSSFALIAETNLQHDSSAGRIEMRDFY